MSALRVTRLFHRQALPQTDYNMTAVYFVNASADMLLLLQVNVNSEVLTISVEKTAGKEETKEE